MSGIWLTFLDMVMQKPQKQTELYYFSAEDAADELEGVIRYCGYEVRDLVEEILENRLATVA